MNSKKTLKRPLKDYFDESDDENDMHISQIQKSAKVDDEIDPLDAFMVDVVKQAEKDSKATSTYIPPEIVSDILDDDYSGGIGPLAYGDDVADDFEGYDSDDVPTSKKPGDKVRIEPLPIIDHSTITYKPFRKDFNREHNDIKALTEEVVEEFRTSENINVVGADVPRPIMKFEQAPFNSKLRYEITRQGFEKPTAIQCQSIPVIMSGRDLIGLAKTGSGKTLAFLWPMIEHILDQPPPQKGDGPIGLVLCPTRELASQIHTEAKKFCGALDLDVCSVFGGVGKWEMTKAVKESPEIIIATPGRLIDLIKQKATNLRRCTMVVLDEADRMFEMGFEYQMRSIVNNIRPNRQTLLFSATMKKRIEQFAREILDDPIRVSVGLIGQANPDIQQVVDIFPNSESRLTWLMNHMDEFVAEGKVLVFVLNKSSTDELAARLRQHFDLRQLAIGVESIHGDKDQADRMAVIRRFKSDEASVLIATDVASRGLDIKDIRTVINYDVPKNIETYVHRIGRTGRMGITGITPGTAYSLLLSHESSFAVDLVQNLRLSGQPVSQELLILAERDPKWSRIHHFSAKNSQGKQVNSSQHSGLGHNHSRAMTSEMMAKESAMRGQGVDIRLPSGVQNISTNNHNSNNSSRISGFTREMNNSSSVAAPSYHSSGPPLRGFVRSTESYSSVSNATNLVDNNSHRPLSNSQSHIATTPILTPSVTNITDANPKRKSRWGDMPSDQ